MESLLANIEWVPVIVSTVLAFLLGWLWYSPTLFVEKWRAGIGQPVWQAPMWMPMSAQLGSTLLLAILVNYTVRNEAWELLVLIVITIMGFVKGSGLYCGKTKTAITIEVLYIFVMALLMVGVHMVF